MGFSLVKKKKRRKAKHSACPFCSEPLIGAAGTPSPSREGGLASSSRGKDTQPLSPRPQSSELICELWASSLDFL